jgi:SAM-dependent methyltransferase
LSHDSIPEYYLPWQVSFSSIKAKGYSRVVSILEKETGSLFGQLWAQLSDEQYRSSVELFTRRADANGFDLRWLNGKRCLDGGCGSARYSVAMAMHRASEVVAVDVSESGLAEAKLRAVAFPQIKFQNASVLAFPFPDGSFDFVWSAGVIHHTADFDKALSELTRVLRPGGKLFLLVYGAGGLRWKAIKAVRPIVADLGPDYIDLAIRTAGLPANNRKHFMDDLFVPVQILTRWDRLSEKLIDNGFANIDRWTGKTYDHEATPEAQLEDIEKLLTIAQAAVTIATNEVDRCLSQLAADTTQLYVSTCKTIMNNGGLSPEVIRRIIIGEGNHRVLAEKKVR